MSTLMIPCPKCAQPLRLRDRALLGKKGKCPSCQHRFLLTVPADGGVESTDAPAEVAADSPVQPERQTSPEPPVSGAATTQVASGDVFARLAVDGEPDGTERLRQRKRTGKRQRSAAVIFGGMLAATGVVLLLMWQFNQAEPPRLPNGQQPQSSSEPPSAVTTTEAGAAVGFVSQAGSVATDATARSPIELLYIPSGAGIIVNLHPRRWTDSGSRGDEVRRCLGPLAAWAEQKIREICRFEPSEVEEVLICLILGQRGNPPDVAAVVHLVSEHQTAVLMKRFGGEPGTRGEHPVCLGDDFGYLIEDSQTFAVVSRALAEETFAAVDDGSVTSPAIEELLVHTDRHRDLTVVFRPDDVTVHEEFLLPQNVRGLSHTVLNWLGEETEAVAWSIQLDDPLSLELLVRNQHGLRSRQLSADRLEKQMSTQWDSLPADVLSWIKTLQPRDAGRRKIVGRFPAMIKAVSLATQSTTDERLVRFSALLPERAAPNLALASLLVWDESTRSPRSPSTPVAAVVAVEKPAARIADRLRQPIEIDFRRTPLEEAFRYIGEETDVVVVIDGKGLESAGYTRNMPQQFQLGTVPATTVLREILKQYDAMVIVVDEDKQLFTVTTKTMAEKNGWTPFSLAK